jgi:hypothetical protein
MGNEDFEIKDGNGKETHVIIPNSVNEIELGAFFGCSWLTHIDIPNSVSNIDNSAFSYCTSLTSIKLPNSVTKIGCYAFCGCDNLASIQIPDSIKYIGLRAFSGIKKIKPQYNPNGSLRAFKAFNKDWRGIHVCTNPLDVFNYYCGKLNTLRFAEVELSGEMDFEGKDSKVAASDIRIIRELTASELFDIYNKMEKE